MINDEVFWYEDPIFDNMEESISKFTVKGDGWRFLQSLREKNMSENEILCNLETFLAVKGSSNTIYLSKSKNTVLIKDGEIQSTNTNL